MFPEFVTKAVFGLVAASADEGFGFVGLGLLIEEDGLFSSPILFVDFGFPLSEGEGSSFFEVIHADTDLRGRLAC